MKEPNKKEIANNSSNSSRNIKSNISQELQSSYLDYAMSVIISRALPDVRDGLKPVQRRILYAMYEDNLRANTKFRKSATVVGSTLGRYHPHGDIAVYDALVRMAQKFSLRYPLIDGQGNFGSVDGDPAAAQRYTECRLSKIAEEMLIDIEKDTVDFRPNYDGSRKEPCFLPAKIPQLLLNGTMGIAVGMATNIPPHNLTEVTNSLIHLIDHPDASIKEIMSFIKGPDFPTGGIIFGTKDIIEAYSQGRGTILSRAKTDIEDNGKNKRIIITEIPYQVNKATLITTIAHLVEEKRIKGIKDLRDESDKEGLRVVIDLKKDSAPHRILEQLFKYTDLEKKFHLNMLALIDNGRQPQILSIKDVLEEYISHRKKVIYRRTQFLLNKAQNRAHILEGLAKALNHIDEIIKLIKSSKSKEDAQNNLIKKYHFSVIQATAILEIKLQSLAKLERQKIDDELKEKYRIIKEYKSILASPKKISNIVKTELKDIQDKYGDPRKTEVRTNLPHTLPEEELIPSQNTFITFSHNGYIKRTLPLNFKTQRRGGKGVIGYEAKNADDFLSYILFCNTRDELLFFTDQGHLFRLKAYEIKEAPRVARGKNINSYLNLRPNEKVIVILNYSSSESARYLLLATEKGTIKKTKLEEYKNIRQSGIVAINLTSNDKLIGASLTQGKDNIILITKQGLSIRFPETEVRPLGRTATGVRGIRLDKEDKVVSLLTIPFENLTKKPTVLVISEKGYGKQTVESEYRKQKRGGKGIKTAKITSRTGDLIKACLVTNEESVIAVSRQGKIIKSTLQGIPHLHRSTQGVKIMKIDNNDSIADITIS